MMNSGPVGSLRKRIKGQDPHIPISEPYGFKKVDLQIAVDAMGKLSLNENSSKDVEVSAPFGLKKNDLPQEIQVQLQNAGIVSPPSSPTSSDESLILCIKFPEGYPFETKNVQLKSCKHMPQVITQTIIRLVRQN
jgi:hypothetical protein